MPEFNPTLLAELVAEEDRLDKQFSAMSEKLNDAYESDKWTDGKRSQYVVDAQRHGQIKRERDAVSERRKEMENLKPVPKKSLSHQQDAFRRWAIGGTTMLDQDEVDQFSNQYEINGNAPGSGFVYTIQPKMGTRSDNASGQELVQETVQPTVVNTLAYYGGVSSMARQFVTSSGNDFRVPQNDAANVEGTLLLEQETAITQNDLANFGVVNFGAYTATSNAIRITREMLQDEIINLEAFAMSQVVRRLGKLWDRLFTAGNKPSNPEIPGVSQLAKLGRTAAGATAITYAEIIDLIYSVARAYREAGGEMGEGGLNSEMGGMTGFLISDGAEALLAKLPDSTGRPLWRPLYESSLANPMGATIRGFPYRVSGNLPAVASGTSPMLFGNFSYYGIRTVNTIEMFRFMDSRTMATNTIEIVGLSRRSARNMATTLGSGANSGRLDMISRLQMA